MTVSGNVFTIFLHIFLSALFHIQVRNPQLVEYSFKVLVANK